MNITDYRVLVGNNANALTEDVQVHIAAGWQPHCGLNVVEGDGTRLFVQAMVKYLTSPR